LKGLEFRIPRGISDGEEDNTTGAAYFMDVIIQGKVLAAVLVVAATMGAVVNKTHFCTMGAVSDWINMGDTGRMRAWLLAIAVAMTGVMVLEATQILQLNDQTFPPYLTGSFAWPRYLLGGLLFGLGMVLASGCGNKTLVRLGGGNLKSLIVIFAMMVSAYSMMWMPLFEKVFLPWLQPLTWDLPIRGIENQKLSTIIASRIPMVSNKVLLGTSIQAIALLFLWVFIFKSKEFRTSFDNVLGGVVVGMAVVGGWYLSAGPLGQSWQEAAQMSIEVPSRVQAQSLTFISPLGDMLRFFMNPTQFYLINFGMVTVVGVVVGSWVWAISSGNFRMEWFTSLTDFLNHIIGGILMGLGGVLAMGCTIGQGISGLSTFALGSLLTFLAIVMGAVMMMKVRYWIILRGS